jgi:pyridoxine/pyridoxamine 5'-phosphate oxidase
VEALTATAQKLIDEAMYLTLATADNEGRPWASPVWFAPVGYSEFLWVSKPEARHSQNLAERPEVAIVIFDSHVQVGAGQAVYSEALAELVPEAELDDAVATFSERSLAAGAGAWSRADVSAPALLRLYRARASAQFVLGPDDRRVPVKL